jgi:hypothetical protein
MGVERFATNLAATRAIKLKVELKLPRGYSQASLILVMCDAKGNVLERITMSAHPDHERAQEELLLFLVRSGFSIRHEDTLTTDLERPLTPDDELSWQQRLTQAFAHTPPLKIKLYQDAHLFEALFDEQSLKLGHLSSDESHALEEWFAAQGFSKVNTVVEDARFGQFTYYYERPEQPS